MPWDAIPGPAIFGPSRSQVAHDSRSSEGKICTENTEHTTAAGDVDEAVPKAVGYRGYVRLRAATTYEVQPTDGWGTKGLEGTYDSDHADAIETIETMHRIHHGLIDSFQSHNPTQQRFNSIRGRHRILLAIKATTIMFRTQGLSLLRHAVTAATTALPTTARPRAASTLSLQAVSRHGPAAPLLFGQRALMGTHASTGTGDAALGGGLNGMHTQGGGGGSGAGGATLSELLDREVGR